MWCLVEAVFPRNTRREHQLLVVFGWWWWLLCFSSAPIRCPEGTNSVPRHRLGIDIAGHCSDPRGVVESGNNDVVFFSFFLRNPNLLDTT